MRRIMNSDFFVLGIDGPSYLSSVEYYDPNTNEWTDTTPMGTSRAASGIAVVTNSIVVEM